MKYLFYLLCIATTNHLNILGMKPPITSEELKNSASWVKNLEFIASNQCHRSYASHRMMATALKNEDTISVEFYLDGGFNVKKSYKKADQHTSYISLLSHSDAKSYATWNPETVEYDPEKTVTLLLDNEAPLVWRNKGRCHVPTWLIIDHKREAKSAKYLAALSHPYSYVSKKEFRAYLETMGIIFLIHKKLSTSNSTLLGKLSKDIIRYVIGKTYSLKNQWAERGASFYKSLTEDFKSLTLFYLAYHSDEKKDMVLTPKPATPAEIAAFKKAYEPLYNSHCARLTLPAE